MRILYCVLVAVFCCSGAFAGDKVGNGGGLWTCFNPDLTVQRAVLVDFYEAQNEFSWSLVAPSATDPLVIVDQLNGSLRDSLPDYAARWSEILSDVKSKIHFTDSELQVVDDSLYRIKPLPSLCRTGWQYVQFANYEPFHIVQIRQDLWDSPAVSALDKAASSGTK
jgi:hypothetical protein